MNKIPHMSPWLFVTLTLWPRSVDLHKTQLYQYHISFFFGQGEKMWSSKCEVRLVFFTCSDFTSPPLFVVETFLISQFLWPSEYRWSYAFVLLLSLRSTRIIDANNRFVDQTIGLENIGLLWVDQLFRQFAIARNAIYMIVRGITNETSHANLFTSIEHLPIRRKFAYYHNSYVWGIMCLRNKRQREKSQRHS